MASPKTQPNDTSVSDFLAAAQPTRRAADAQRLDRIMREETGEEPMMWGASIVGYGRMIDRRSPDSKQHSAWPKVAFSPRKASLTLYGITEVPEAAALLSTLGEHTTSVGCVYIKRLDAVDEQVLRAAIRAAAAAHEDAPES